MKILAGICIGIVIFLLFIVTMFLMLELLVFLWIVFDRTVAEHSLKEMPPYVYIYN